MMYESLETKLLSDYDYLLVIVLFLYEITVYGYLLLEYKRNSLIFFSGHPDVVGSFPSQYTFCCLPFLSFTANRNNGLMLRPKRIMPKMVWSVVLKCGILLKIRDDNEPNNLQSNLIFLPSSFVEKSAYSFSLIFFLLNETLWFSLFFNFFFLVLLYGENWRPPFLFFFSIGIISPIITGEN